MGRECNEEQTVAIARADELRVTADFGGLSLGVHDGHVTTFKSREKSLAGYPQESNPILERDWRRTRNQTG